VIAEPAFLGRPNSKTDDDDGDDGEDDDDDDDDEDDEDGGEDDGWGLSLSLEHSAASFVSVPQPKARHGADEDKETMTICRLAYSPACLLA